MTGWNLPPGVSENMIPGNRPEDAEDERFWNALYQKLSDLGWAEKRIESLEDNTSIQQVIQVTREIAYAIGVAEGQADGELTAYAKMQKQEENRRAKSGIAPCGHPAFAGDHCALISCWNYSGKYQ
jgi:hypothetical protein